MRSYIVLGAAYVGLVVLANYLASTRVWHVPFTPYLAPAGVFAIGVILVLRDWLQQLHGLARTMPLVYAAGLLSWGIGDLAGWTALQKVAVGSVVAFSVSETVEAVVFTPLRNRSLTLGVALSGTVGMAVDSALFLWLAFGSLAFFWGQFWGKLEMVVLGTLLTAGRRALVALPRPVT